LHRSVDCRRIGILKEEAALEFAVILIFDAYGESALIGDNRGQLPSIRKFPRYSLLLGNWDFPHRTEHETILCAEQGKSTSGVEVQRVQLLLEGSALIDSFAESIGRLKQQTVGV